MDTRRNPTEHLSSFVMFRLLFQFSLMIDSVPVTFGTVNKDQQSVTSFTLIAATALETMDSERSLLLS